MIHRYHLPYYQQVAVYFWPILFFELWRVDRWSAETGRRAFVQVDRYGRAWVPWFEGMSQKPHLNGVFVEAYKPGDVEAWCPGVFETALATLAVDASARWDPGTTLPTHPIGTFMPWTPACAGVGGDRVRLTLRAFTARRPATGSSTLGPSATGGTNRQYFTTSQNF